jgi:hypothetical protein
VGQALRHGAQFGFDRTPHHGGQSVCNHPVELALDVRWGLRHIDVGGKVAQVLGFVGHGCSARVGQGGDCAGAGLFFARGFTGVKSSFSDAPFCTGVGLDLSLAVSHRVHILETGMVASQGAAQDLALDPEFKRRYLGL